MCFEMGVIAPGRLGWAYRNTPLCGTGLFGGVGIAIRLDAGLICLGTGVLQYTRRGNNVLLAGVWQYAPTGCE